MKRIRLLIGLAAVLAACTGLSGCSWVFGMSYPNLPSNSGPITPLTHCSQPEGANAYLELDVTNPDQILKVGDAWVYVKLPGWKTHHWVHTDLLQIKLVRTDSTHSLFSWSADVPQVDWMGAVYQGWVGGGQVNTLNPDDLHDQHFTEQVVVHPVAGQRYALYASLPPGTVERLGCYATNGQQPFLSL